MRAASVLFIMVLTAALAAGAARADVAEISFEGVIDRARGDLPQDIIADQTRFWGTLTVDTDSIDRRRSPVVGDYRSAVLSTHLGVADYELGGDLLTRALVHDDVDRVTFVGRPGVPAFDGRTLRRSQLQLTDSTRDLLGGDSLSQLFGLSLKALDDYRGAVLTLSGRGDSGAFRLSGRILSMNVSAVPAPGAALLAAAGFGLVGLVRRRRT
ncbi:MAG: hypothetical protein C4547_04080 [Phycisphaerales bacterium]|nr:MAG: hypothetical protein C4547_04080 [Phycisphaerales bacterium]